MTQTDATGSRRSFVNWFLGTSAGALMFSILYPVVRFISPPRIPEAATGQVQAGMLNDPELMEKNFKIVPFGAEPVIVIRAADRDIRALAATCTHLDCIVEYQKEQKIIWCNCHNGVYNLAGQVLAGPPPRPLEVFKVDLVAQGGDRPDIIVVSRS